MFSSSLYLEKEKNSVIIVKPNWNKKNWNKGYIRRIYNFHAKLWLQIKSDLLVWLE